MHIVKKIIDPSHIQWIFPYTYTVEIPIYLYSGDSHILIQWRFPYTYTVEILENDPKSREPRPMMKKQSLGQTFFRLFSINFERNATNLRGTFVRVASMSIHPSYCTVNVNKFVPDTFCTSLYFFG
jgi:hypothetical protein